MREYRHRLSRCLCVVCVSLLPNNFVAFLDRRMCACIHFFWHTYYFLVLCGERVRMLRSHIINKITRNDRKIHTQILKDIWNWFRCDRINANKIFVLHIISFRFDNFVVVALGGDGDGDATNGTRWIDRRNTISRFIRNSFRVSFDDLDVIPCLTLTTPHSLFERTAIAGKQ